MSDLIAFWFIVAALVAIFRDTGSVRWRIACGVSWPFALAELLAEHMDKEEAEINKEVTP